MNASPSHMPDWPHSPPHRLDEAGAYMVTAGTYRKAHHFNSASRLDLMRDQLFSCSEEFGWKLHAWAILSNHYHFVASSPGDPQSLRVMISKMHTLSARPVNARDNQPGRKVWFQYFDSHLTYPASYYARLKYVHNNPVHHGVVLAADNYPWCSASWFARSVRPAFRKMVEQFRTDRIHVHDEFAGLPMEQLCDESGVKPPHSTSSASSRIT